MTPEMEKLQGLIAGPNNFVTVPKHQVKEMIELWRSVLELRQVLEKSPPLMRDEKVFKAWTEVRSRLVKMG